MSRRFAIWDKESMIITPSGEVFSPEQWIARYPVAGVKGITVVCAAGEYNGAIFDTLGNLVHVYESQGVDFSGCTTPEEKLSLIEAFEDERKLAQMEAASVPSAQERIAAALEYQVMASLPDVEEEVVETTNA